jgi:hypothetical protein
MGQVAQTSFGVYGPSAFENLTQQARGTGRREQKSQALPDRQLPMASSTEDLNVTKDTSVQINVGGAEPIMEEYNAYIVEYFKRMAEQ